MRKGKSLYSIFIVNSILATLIFIIGIIILIYLLLFGVRDSVNNKNLETIKNEINYLFKENYNDIDINKVLSEGGWIEEVENGKVVNVKGSKKDKKEFYSIEDFINEKNTNYKYEARAYKQGDKLYIIKIPDYNYKLFHEMYGSKKAKIYISLSLLLTTLIVFLMFILLSILSIKKISRPLKILENEIKKMSEGYSNVSVKFNSYREFNKIKESFNSTVDKLEKSEIERKIAEDSKKRIIRDISHDLKTPITSILGYSKAISEGVVTNEEEKKIYLDYIYNKTKRINYLVDELFVFSKLDSPGYKLNLEKKDISEFLRELVALYYIDIEDKGFLLEVNIPEESIYSIIDTKALERALGNIIINAIKYNEVGTIITVELIKSDKYVDIIIEDNGYGISDEVIENIFDEFVRADKARKTDGGSGLGLAITKKIINLHNGKLKLYSEKDIGTKFSIRLDIL
ncbi:MAG: HAMP domain-containing histidine kinase [Paraclostridium bifermentans]|uniref:sensor histidine kinase n=1 Tax=Paraclostridium bifermentans TaxID=1490 RepID=UPI001D8577D2|nr:HAMP domain-containing sensor histidine kinase [Paraclostridium bifermentans]MBS6508821.1 HAMP domain-containing histidine kinase [Paraclostridium bifermentans]MDU3803292.1 HAMP domain-containing sensor histidine kinase [Paraclostridium bifermentans]